MNYEIKCGDCVESMQAVADRSVGAIITSPPYDGIRSYAAGNQFDTVGLGRQIARVLMPGGFAVVVIADQKKNKRLSLTTARLIVDWCDQAGLSLCDWLIYHRMGRIGRFHSFRRDHESILVFFAGDVPRDINTTALKKPVKKSRVGNMANVSTRDNDKFNKKQYEVKSDMMCRGSVWTYHSWGTGRYKPEFMEAHPATMPISLAYDLVLGFSNAGDIVLDPFMGSGTTGVAALMEKRRFVGIDISEDYCTMARHRIVELIDDQLLIGGAADAI